MCGGLTCKFSLNLGFQVYGDRHGYTSKPTVPRPNPGVNIASYTASRPIDVLFNFLSSFISIIYRPENRNGARPDANFELRDAFLTPTMRRDDPKRHFHNPCKRPRNLQNCVTKFPAVSATPCSRMVYLCTRITPGFQILRHNALAPVPHAARRPVPSVSGDIPASGMHPHALSTTSPFQL